MQSAELMLLVELGGRGPLTVGVTDPRFPVGIVGVGVEVRNNVLLSRELERGAGTGCFVHIGREDRASTDAFVGGLLLSDMLMPEAVSRSFMSFARGVEASTDAGIDDSFVG